MRIDTKGSPRPKKLGEELQIDLRQKARTADTCTLFFRKCPAKLKTS